MPGGFDLADFAENARLNQFRALLMARVAAPLRADPNNGLVLYL
jgi:hypothetical protein